MMFLNRAGAQGLRTAARTQQMRTAATLATFKTPTVFNEPNQHYAKGSQQREGLNAAIEKLQKKLPIEVPVVVGGKEVSLLHTIFPLLSPESCLTQNLTDQGFRPLQAAEPCRPCHYCRLLPHCHNS
jgi:hypothetical protein